MRTPRSAAPVRLASASAGGGPSPKPRGHPPPFSPSSWRRRAPPACAPRDRRPPTSLPPHPQAHPGPPHPRAAGRGALLVGFALYLGTFVVSYGDLFRRRDPLV